jgi:hypothetical protein
MHLDFGHGVDPERRVAVVVALIDVAAGQRDLLGEDRAEAEAAAGLHHTQLQLVGSDPGDLRQHHLVEVGHLHPPKPRGQQIAWSVRIDEIVVLG